MPGAPISRWTMAYFAAAVSFLIAALGLLVMGFGSPMAPLSDPDTLVVVHLVAIGWLGLLFCGALLQFAPVLAAASLRMPALAFPALWGICLGLAALLVGFLSMGGHVDGAVILMPVGGALLSLGAGCVVAMVSTTLISKKAFAAPGLFVLLGQAAIGVTAVMGLCFALILSGVVDLPAMADALPSLVPFHASSGLLAGMTLTAVGVSYRLFAMFMLSPEHKATSRAIPALVIASLVCLYAAALLSANGTTSWLVILLAVVLALAAATLYGLDVLRLFRTRKRKALELNVIGSLAALAFFGVGLALFAVDAIFDVGHRIGVTGFYILAMGWLTGLGLSQLYKIVPFLTWLETYGSVMGKAQVPRVQDLVDERHASLLFVVYYGGVVVGIAGILFGSDTLFRIASAAQFCAVSALALEYIRARKLVYAPTQLRLPGGASMPHLIHATTH